MPSLFSKRRPSAGSLPTTSTPVRRHAPDNALRSRHPTILMCGIKQRDMAPWNLVIQPPSHDGSASFWPKEDCPVRFAVNPDNVRSVMIDFDGSELWDPDHEFYNKQTREREIHALTEDYMEDWWYRKYGI